MDEQGKKTTTKTRGSCLLTNIEVEFNIHRQVLLISAKPILQFALVSASIVLSNLADDVTNTNLVAIRTFDVLLSKRASKTI